MPCLDCKNHFVRVVAYNGVSNPELALVIPLSAVPANVFVYDNQTMPLLSLPNRIKTKEWIANVNARRAKGLRGCKLAV